MFKLNVLLLALGVAHAEGPVTSLTERLHRALATGGEKLAEEMHLFPRRRQSGPCANEMFLCMVDETCLAAAMSRDMTACYGNSLCRTSIECQLAKDLDGMMCGQEVLDCSTDSACKAILDVPGASTTDLDACTANEKCKAMLDCIDPNSGGGDEPEPVTPTTETPTAYPTWESTDSGEPDDDIIWEIDPNGESVSGGEAASIIVVFIIASICLTICVPCGIAIFCCGAFGLVAKKHNDKTKAAGAESGSVNKAEPTEV